MLKVDWHFLKSVRRILQASKRVGVATTNLLNSLLDGRSPDSLAFIDSSGKSILTSEINEVAASYASVLRDLSVRKGDVVSIKLDKRVEVFFLAYGCFHLGAVLHPINTDYTAKETNQIIIDAGSRLVICEDIAGFSELAPELGVPTANLLTIEDIITRAQKLDLEDSPIDVAEVPSDHIAVLLYTSGTTGKPKGACITHSNLAESAAALATVWQIDSKDTLLHALPIYHAHGLLTSVNTMLVGGGSVMLLPKFDLDDVIDALPNTTVLMGVPTHYARLVASDRLVEASRNLRLVISGSAPLPVNVAKRFREATKLSIRERYGATETAIVTATPSDAVVPEGWVGWPLPGVELRARAGDGSVSERAVTGELETRGHNVFAGYLNNDGANDESFTEDGWFCTGDIGEIDTGGCLRLLARSKDIVITGGLNVYPVEVENMLASVPGISAAAVFGVPHPDFGEAVIGAVELEPGVTSLDESAAIDHVRASLAGFKTPKKLVVCELPRNLVGKVVKAELRATYANLFNLCN